MRPLSTSRRLVSTSRAINGAAAIVNGTIAAAGTHRELLESSPLYREIYEQQTGAAGNGGEAQ